MAGPLETVMAGERNQGWRRKSLLFLSFDLMRDRAGHTGRRGGEDATDVIRRAARRARVGVRPVGTVRGDEVIDSLIAAPQSAHLPCVEAAIAAAESGRTPRANGPRTGAPCGSPTSSPRPSTRR